MIMRFKWVGISREGFKITAEADVAQKEILLRQLKQQGVIVISLKKINKKPYCSSLKISSKKIAEFTRQLAILCEANIDLIQSFKLLIQQETEPGFKKLLDDIKNRIENGGSFSDTLKHYSHYFDRIYCGIIQAGEQSGSLTKMLLHLAHYQENMQELKRKITKALFYPISLISTATLITIALLIYVAPQFKTIFNSFGSQLPWFTQAVMNTSQILQKHIVLIVFSIFTAVLFYTGYLRKLSGFKCWLDKIKLSLPFLNQMIINSIFARWAWVMSSLLTAKLSLLDSLIIANQTLANQIIQIDMQRIINRINEGEAVHQTLSTHPYFPKQLIPLLAIGENSGRLPEMLQRMAQLQQTRLDQQMDYFTQWLEPAAMLILAIMIGSLIIAMYLPIFQLGAII